jgi:PHD/YefM family antitoxin component YafN of YafNO toxin-antitoxin module
MTTVTIPKNLTKQGDLVVISRKEYEAMINIVKEKRIIGHIDKGLEKALQEAREGKVIGPFKSVKALMKSLNK